jgi:hypothetical protein
MMGREKRGPKRERGGIWIIRMWRWQGKVAKFDCMVLMDSVLVPI